MIRPSCSSCLYSGVPGNGVAIANRGRSIAARSTNSTVRSKMLASSPSRPKTKQPLTAIPCSWSFLHRLDVAIGLAPALAHVLDRRGRDRVEAEQQASKEDRDGETQQIRDV